MWQAKWNPRSHRPHSGIKSSAFCPSTCRQTAHTSESLASSAELSTSSSPIDSVSSLATEHSSAHTVLASLHCSKTLLCCCGELSATSPFESFICNGRFGGATTALSWDGLKTEPAAGRRLSFDDDDGCAETAEQLRSSSLPESDINHRQIM